MFCLTCKRLSQPGSAYCQFCEGGKSFNAVYCSGGHRCSIGSRSCPTCGSGEFSEHVYGLPTGWIARGVSIALLILVWKVGLAHGGDVLGALGTGAGYAFGFATNSDHNALGYLIQVAAFYLTMAWVVGLWLSLLPGGGGAAGKFLRGIPLLLWKLAARWLPKLAGGIGKGVVRFFGLIPGRSSSPGGRSKDGGDRGGH